MNSIKQFLSPMKPVLLGSAAVVLMAALLNSCDLIDPTQVRNPQITDESIVGQPGSMTASLSGVKSTFSSLIANTAYFTDCVSDNYQNVSTFISPNVDDPRAMRSDDLTLNGGSLYPLALQVRALADFGINKVAPGDPTLQSTQVGDERFYRGMATLILAENFSNVPLTAGGPASSNNDVIDAAIADLSASLTTASATLKTASQFALARAYRLRGNKAQAVAAANAAIALNNTFVFSAGFDAQTLTNTTWNFVVSRNLNDMQPLPRLDFLDPKYTDATGISPVPVLKAEEMYLILAEAALSDNDLATAKARMKDATTLANGSAGGRGPAISFTDKDPRTGRPNADNTVVQADANSPARAGLVKKRSNTVVAIRPISATSVATTDIDALVSAKDHLWMVALLRQEIFILEGRRMSDLGIRLPVMKRETDTNTSMPSGSSGTLVVVPSYIPTSNTMDKFTTSGTTVTCTIDMNQVIATNKVSPFTLPF